MAEEAEPKAKGWGDLEPEDATDSMSKRPVREPAFREVAGIDLCKRLICIISVVILVVLAATFVTEWVNGSRAAEAQKRVSAEIVSLKASVVTPERVSNSLDSLEQLKALATGKTVTPGLDAMLATHAHRVEKLLEDVGSLDEVAAEREYWTTQAKLLGESTKTLDNLRKGQAEVLDQLVSSLKARAASLPKDGAHSERLTSAKELLKDIEVSREAERKHVFGLAQLVLVNVLLPLLTAMFGYIFGVGQAGREEPEK